MITIIIEGYLDGVPVKRELTQPSRWEVQEAEKVTLVFGRRSASTTSMSTSASIVVSIDQSPRSLSTTKVGVGAVLWDGGIVLAALLASCLPSEGASLFGEVVVELGAGVGAPSIAAALRGARVVATDREAAVAGVLRRNASSFLSDSCKLPPDPGKVALATLEFGTPEGDAAAAALADAICAPSSSSSSSSASVGVGGSCGGGIDLVLAADCVYVDGADEDKTPDPRGLCRAAARLLLRPAPFERNSEENRGDDDYDEYGDGGDGGENDDGSASCRSPRSRRRYYHCPPSSRAWIAAELRDAKTHALFVEAAGEHFASVRMLALPADVFGSTGGGGGGGGGGGDESGDESGSGGGGGGWSHVRLFELAGPRTEAALVGASGGSPVVAVSAAEMRVLKKPRKRGWP